MLNSAIFSLHLDDVDVNHISIYLIIYLNYLGMMGMVLIISSQIFSCLQGNNDMTYMATCTLISQNTTPYYMILQVFNLPARVNKYQIS